MTDVQVSINRAGNSLDEAPIRFVVRIAMGKTITVTMSPEDFALALTGVSDRPATMKLRNLNVEAV